LTRLPSFHRARACLAYLARSDSDSPLGIAVHRFKYGREVTLAPCLSRLLVDLCPLDPNYDVIVPVPLHISRLRWRGFNQALVLAKPLARHWQVPIDPFLLRRVRATASQVGLDESERRRNIAGAFEVSKRSAIRRKRILLVDDVYTTGATLNECARTLRRAGAERVDALVLARTVLS
jgi:ComF family protein